MTTIVYDKAIGSFLSDSYETQGDVICCSTKKKIYILDHYVLACAGDGEGIRRVLETFPNCSDVPYNSACGFAFDRHTGKVFEWGWDTEDDDSFCIIELEFSYSIGSGSSFALGALDCGVGGRLAVEIAIDRDIYSGGKVQEVKLEDYLIEEETDGDNS